MLNQCRLFGFRPAVAVGVVLTADRERIVLLEDTTLTTSRFRLPGGSITADDSTPAEAAMRRLHQQTGVFVYADQLTRLPFSDSVDGGSRLVYHVNLPEIRILKGLRPCDRVTKADRRDLLTTRSTLFGNQADYRALSFVRGQLYKRK